MAHKRTTRLISTPLVALALLSLSGCAGLSGIATDAALGALNPDKGGIELTAQVGKENNKGLINTKVDLTDDVAIDDIKGDANVNSGNIINNKTSSMIGLVLTGMIPCLLLLVYFLPAPKWLKERHG